MALPNGVKPQYAIFTADREFADYEIDAYAKSHNCPIAKRVKSMNESFAIMEDGTKYKWIKPTDMSRGNKCSTGVIDLATCSLEYIRDFIPAICIFAEKENFVFVDSEHNFKEEQSAYDLHTLIDRLQKVESILGNIKKLSFFEECGYAIIRSLDVHYDEISFDGW